MATVRRFEFKQGTSSKFWEISLEDRQVHVRFGRIGTDGQRSDKKLASPAHASKEHGKLVAEKLKKGYVEAESVLPVIVNAGPVSTMVDRNTQPPSAESKPGPGLSDAERVLLEQDLERLKVHDAGLPQRALKYVLENEDEDVLAVLSRTKDSLEGLRLGAAFALDQKSPRAEFFRILQSRDVGLLLRLAKVYEAAARVQVFPWWPGTKAQDGWLRGFLTEAGQVSRGVYPERPRPCPVLDSTLIEEMLTLDGKGADGLVHAALFAELKRIEGEALFAQVPGFAESALRHAHVVREAMADKDPSRRAHTLDVMARYGIDPAPFAGEMVDLGVGSSKRVREGAEAHLHKIADSVRSRLEGVAANGTADARSHAVGLLARIGGARVVPFLERRLEAEPAKGTRDQIENLLASLASASAPSESEPVSTISAHCPLTPDAEAAFRACIEEINRIHEELGRGPNAVRRLPKQISPERVEEAVESLKSLVPGEKEGRYFLAFDAYDTSIRKALSTFLEHPDLHLIHAVRTLILFTCVWPGSEHDRTYGFRGEVDRYLTVYRRRHPPPTTLRALADVLTALGLDDRRIGRCYLRSSGYYYGQPFPWGAEAVWPYFAERLDLLETAFAARPGYLRYWGGVERSRALDVLLMFPSPPPTLSATLWELALGPGKLDRPRAQAALERAVDRTPKTVRALESKKAETRAIAAEWLGRQGDPSAIEPLTRAIDSEVNENARGAMLTALELLGAPIEPYVNREALQREARTGLASSDKSRRALAWFPFGDLPRVRWDDTGKTVPAAVLEWLLLQSHKLATPDPGALLRRHTAAFRTSDRQALGGFILERWIAQDLSGASAIAHRGILAIPAAGCDGSLVPSVSRYVRQNYGLRMPQCKALLQMLAWIDDPSVVQLLVSIATRFRTKGIQTEAKRLLEVMAEERGWSVEQLADRSIPTAGFAADGTLRLDYGPRQLVARIAGDGLALFGEDGQAIRSLPEPRRGDDSDKAREAKALFEDARRELKTTLQLQKNRLYEALCTQRTWLFEDWERFLNRHPIVGRYCRRLAWMVVGEGSAVLFRPLEDGSLTSLDDSPVVVETSQRVKIAHASLIAPDLCAAWREHFLDYEVEPLFQQLGRPVYRLSEGMKDDSDLRDFEGHLIESATLRGQALALGYERGPFEGHMWFQLYRKRFEGLALEALIYFSGTRPNESHPVALRRLSFAPLDPTRRSEHPGESIPLGEIPSVLLSECWNDIRAVAAAGSGFDDGWQKKVGW